jgi:Xaa-Pro aminopeptidase
MIRDLDVLMTVCSIDVVIVPMHESMHASFRWLTRGAKVTRGYAVMAAGRAPLLIAYPMERDEAAATGLEVKLVDEFGHDSIFAEAPSAAVAYATLFQRIVASVSDGRRLAFFGNAPLHLYAGIIREMESAGFTVYREGDDLIQLARKTKEPHEVNAIRSAATRTAAIIAEVRTLVRSCNIIGGLLHHRGAPLTLGVLKQLTTTSIVSSGMIEDHETILSQGRDAGIPHSRGNADAFVRAGVPIVMDIFPADRETGYFCDLTRTFAAGEIPSRLRRIYDDVRAAWELAAAAMRPGAEARSYQAMVCDFFEAKGYPTTRSHPSTTNGYVHSLGHGVGLDIHERPFFSLVGGNRDRIEEGDIVTIEPGLYFPDEEIGVRIEDTFLVTSSCVESLCNAPLGLEA